MKVPLALTIESSLLEDIKKFAADQGTSVSELVEGYFKVVTMLKTKQNFMQLTEQLPVPNIPKDAKLMDLYFQLKNNESNIIE